MVEVFSPTTITAKDDDSGSSEDFGQMSSKKLNDDEDELEEKQPKRFSLDDLNQFNIDKYKFWCETIKCNWKGVVL